MGSQSTRREALAAAAGVLLAGCSGLRGGGGSGDEPRDCGRVRGPWPTAGGSANRSGTGVSGSLPPTDAPVARYGLPVNGRRRGPPVVGPERVFVPHPGGLRALSRDTLDTEWTASVAGYATAVGCGSVFAAGERRLVALDPATGRRRWRAEVPGEFPTRSLAVVGSTLFAGGAAFDAATGERRYGTRPAARRVAVGRHAYVAADAVTALDRHTGAVLWQTEGDGNRAARVAASGDLVAVTDGVGFVTALDARTGERRWRSAEPVDAAAAPAVAGGAVVVPEATGTAHCFDARTGEHRWQADVGACRAQPTVVGDTVVFPVENDGWAAVALADGAVRGRYAVAGSEHAPVVASGRLFYCGVNNDFYVVG
jgi:outer membrane protein assembly factor BamB